MSDTPKTPKSPQTPTAKSKWSWIVDIDTKTLDAMEQRKSELKDDIDEKSPDYVENVKWCDNMASWLDEIAIKGYTEKLINKWGFKFVFKTTKSDDIVRQHLTNFKTGHYSTMSLTKQ
jgi:hypothetical protein